MASYQPLQGVSIQGSTPTLYPPSNEDGLMNSRTSFEPKAGETSRLTRTPSPTPSEARELETGAVNWKTLSTRKFWFRKEWIVYYVILIVVLVVTALTIIYHRQIVQWLTPAAMWLHGVKVGWLVPIAVLFVISFPPLFGHEIVAVLCGLVWGLGVGFAIVSAGTLLGEIGNFYAFKFCCRARGEKLEKTKLTYACLARVVREGGFKIALIARLSAIPGHFTTAIFSTCGMNIFVFTLAALLSMPKQFITVYLGVILKESSTGGESKQSKIISDVVVAITVLITVGAMWYILRLMNSVKPQIIYERRKARQAKLQRAEQAPYLNEEFSPTTDVFHPNTSDSDIPLTINNPDGHHQQWDRHGSAVGYAADPNLISPRNIISPRPLVANTSFIPSKYPRDVEEGGNLMGKRGRQESTDEVGWQQPEDPYAPDSFVQIPSSSTKNPYPNERHVQTPTQSNFVNGPLTMNLSPTATDVHFEDIYGSTTSFHSAPDSPRQYHTEALPNPFSSPGKPLTSQPESSPQVRPPSYIAELR